MTEDRDAEFAGTRSPTHSPFELGLFAVNQWLVIALMAAMTVLVVGNVFSRYVLNYSIVWAEEITRCMMIGDSCCATARRSQSTLITRVRGFQSWRPDERWRPIGAECRREPPGTSNPQVVGAKLLRGKQERRRNIPGEASFKVA